VSESAGIAGSWPYNKKTSICYQSRINYPEDAMHILSLSDIKLIIELFESQGVVADATGRERQVSNLIKMGYLRPLSAVYTLTELGEKTARSLAMRKFVPSMMLPASEPAVGASEPTSDTAAETTAETPPDTPALQEA
jgi:hypothetical protein